jgi:hypothetical protein
MLDVAWPVQLWQRTRKPIIALAVLLHFAIGLCCFAVRPSALLDIPGLSRATDLYLRLDFPQTWRMFAPPSQTQDEIGYALRFEAGWTKLKSFDDFLKETVSGRTLLPRGYIRVADHLRHPTLRKKLKDEPFYLHYFQQMSAFFCFGDGAIPGLKTIRFYSISKGVAPFFADDGRGHAFPKASDYDQVSALYQRDCEDR